MKPDYLKPDDTLYEETDPQPGSTPKQEMAENINIVAVSEEEMMFDAKGLDGLMETRKGTGLLSGLPGDLQAAAMEGNWETAQEIFSQDRNATTQRISTMGFTALHVAASSGESEFVVKLVELLHPKDLEIRDQLGRTALHHAAVAADVSAAKALVKKNPQLPLLGDYVSQTPILYAASWRHRLRTKEMLEYLYEVTPDDEDKDIYMGRPGENLVVAITASQCYDVALRILARHPELALAKNNYGISILHVLAMQPTSFIDGSKLSSVWELLIKGKKINVPETKQRQEESLRLVELVCKELRKQSDSYIFNYFFDDYKGNALLHLAVENGVLKMVEMCLKYFPDLIWYTRNNRTLLHEAIEHRRVHIFNHLIRLIGENTKAYAESKIDENENNILHLAAQYSAPTNQLMIHTVPGPAFEMRRELQWFKAVEALVYEELTMEKNKEVEESIDKTVEKKKMGKEIKGLAPRELFFKQHEQLLKDAKEWMKDTSNSCMLVATLVATVAFAAMITVPGGSNSDTGLPVLSNRKLFVAFSISNAASMISSALTLLMFLSVYTSRFTEKDFLETFPKILLRGLISLFIAIATMMIAFGTAIGLVLQRRVKWAYIPITVIACCPALIFTKLQLPLLFQTIVFAPGPGMYQGQRDHKSSRLEKIGDRPLSKDMC